MQPRASQLIAAVVSLAVVAAVAVAAPAPTPFAWNGNISRRVIATLPGAPKPARHDNKVLAVVVRDGAAWLRFAKAARIKGTPALPADHIAIVVSWSHYMWCGGALTVAIDGDHATLSTNGLFGTDCRAGYPTSAVWLPDTVKTVSGASGELTL